MTTRPSPPFARQRETAEAWEHVRPGRGVLITGGPGAGRTTFARAIVQLAERHGQAPLWSAPTATTRDLPLGALAASVGDLATRDPLGAADIAAAADRLRRHGGSSSTVLVVDDAHLLDQLSAEVVLQAVATRSIALVATMPDDGTLPSGVARLVVDGFVHTVALAALPRAEFEELTATLLGGPVAGATAELLWRWSEGVPHVAAAIVEAGRVAGKFHPIAGRWWWRGATSVPDRPAARLDRPLDAGASVSAEEADAALDLIAVAGPIELDRVERLVDLDVLATLERRGLIATADDQGATVVRCRGPLVARQRVRSIGALRRRRAARRLLDAVPARSSPSELVRRAVWHVDGDLPAPPDVLRRAESVARLTDPAVAHRLAAADQRWNGGVGALVALVETHLESGEPDAARAALAHADAMASSGEDRALVDRERIALALFGEHAPTDARRAAERARAAGTVPPSEPRSWDALIALLEARPGAAGVHAAAVLDEPSATAEARLRAALVSATAAMLGGRTTEALARVEALRPHLAVAAVEMPSLPGMLAAVEAFTHLWRGELPAVPDALPLTGRWPSPPPIPSAPVAVGNHRFRWALLAGVVAHQRGEVAAAVGDLADAAVQQRDGKGLFHAEAVAWLAVAQSDAGSPTAAQATLVAFPERHLAVIPGLHGWASGVLAAEREPYVAALHFLGAADRAARVGARLAEAHYLVELAERCPAEAPIERLDELADSLDAALLACLCRLAVNALKQDHEAMLDRAVQLGGFGATARAVATATRAGRAARHSGVRATERRARRLVRQLRGVGEERSGPLTGREAEVAEFAAGGLTDREIAARLVVSVRTVESHLASAYRKLAISSRAELALHRLAR